MRLFANEMFDRSWLHLLCSEGREREIKPAAHPSSYRHVSLARVSSSLVMLTGFHSSVGVCRWIGMVSRWSADGLGWFRGGLQMDWDGFEVVCACFERGCSGCWRLSQSISNSTVPPLCHLTFEQCKPWLPKAPDLKSCLKSKSKAPTCALGQLNSR
uniref:Uncharacterized protein n=1 Tax=Aquila chrysaetos chrysaetos TaxID=223781 RepID=A0A663F0B9_AQUCH